MNYDHEDDDSSKLIIAVREGDLKEVKRLIDNGYDPAENNNEPIIEAAIHGQTEIVRYLVDLDEVSPAARGNQAFFSACTNDSKDIVEILAEQTWPDGEHIINRDLLQEGFITACENGSMEVLNFLANMYDDDADEYVVNPGARDNTAFIGAVINGHLDIVRRLLEMTEYGVEPNAQNDSALVAAAENGHIEILELLLDIDEVNPFAQDNEALRLASQNDHVEVVKLLINKYHSVNIEPSSIYDVIQPRHRKYIMLYYRINKIRSSMQNSGRTLQDFLTEEVKESVVDDPELFALVYYLNLPNYTRPQFEQMFGDEVPKLFEYLDEYEIDIPDLILNELAQYIK